MYDKTKKNNHLPRASVMSSESITGTEEPLLTARFLSELLFYESKVKVAQGMLSVCFTVNNKHLIYN